jgi:GAF domain-containing protein
MNNMPQQTTDKTQFYKSLKKQASALLEGESDLIAQAANLCALLWYSLPDINWVGFYFYKNGELVLGPFQGKPACVRIKPGQGVCGTAFQNQKTYCVDNVHAFDGHIACDPDSRSEIVIPFFMNHTCKGVLDIDSPLIKRFHEEDQIGLEHIVRSLEENIR